MKLHLPLLLVFTGILNFYSLRAQDSTDKLFIGGSAGFTITQNQPENNMSSDSKTFSLLASPMFGYYVHTKITNTSYDEGAMISNNISSYLVSPFFRYYFSRFFCQVQFNTGWSKAEMEYYLPLPEEIIFTKSEVKYSTLGYGAGMGYNLILGEHISLEPMITYTSNQLHEKRADSNSTQKNMFFSLGFIYRL